MKSALIILALYGLLAALAALALDGLAKRDQAVGTDNTLLTVMESQEVMWTPDPYTNLHFDAELSEGFMLYVGSNVYVIHNGEIAPK